MSRRLVIKQIAALMLLMLFMSGCSTKEVITTPVQVPALKIPKQLYLPSKPDFSKRATNEKEASDMVWELYLYIMELNYTMEALNGGK